MNMTREEAIRNFREHWASNAVTGVDNDHKHEYLKRHGYSNIKHDCFLCEFVYQQNGIRNCGICPIEWPDTKNDYPRDNHPCVLSYFGDWFQAAIPEERKRLAALIRDLPEKAEKQDRPFQVGDRVRVVNYDNNYRGWRPLKPINGKTGTIIGATGSNCNVCFDAHIGGHGENNKCWCIKHEFIELLPPLNHCPEPKTIAEIIRYIFKGAKTTCIIENEQGRFKGTAKCSPQDEWNESRGMALAKIRAEEAMLKAGR